MSSFVQWFLILLFGWLFMGWEFYFYVFVASLLLMVYVSYRRNHDND